MQFQGGKRGQDKAGLRVDRQIQTKSGSEAGPAGEIRTRAVSWSQIKAIGLRIRVDPVTVVGDSMTNIRKQRFQHRISEDSFDEILRPAHIRVRKVDF